MYTVVEIAPYNTKKVKVKLDNGFTFALYKGEVRKYNLKEDNYILDDIYNEIIYGILMKRARERALYLLKDSSKTRMQIREKLKKDYYPDVVVDETIDFLEKYNYINDYEFAMNYLERNIGTKSLYKMKNELYIKGIPKEIMEEALVNTEISEDDSIRKLIDKKIKRYDLGNPKEKRKFYGLLQRNGYSYDVIQRALGAMDFEVQ